jgi:membrane protein
MIQKFNADEGTLLAAAIAFNMILCAAPLLLLFVSVFGYIFVNFDAPSREVLQFFDRVLPLAMPQVVVELERVTSHWRVFGFIGIIGFAWASLRLFGSVRLALDRVFEPEQAPGYVVGKLTDLLNLVLMGFLLLLSVSVTSGLSILRGLLMRALHAEAPWLGVLWHAVGLLIGFLLTGGMFFIIYQAAPHRRPRVRTSLVAALAASIVWELAKLGFGVFFRNVGALGTVFGSVGVFIVLLSWVYLSAMIVVVAGEFAWVREKRL